MSSLADVAKSLNKAWKSEVLTPGNMIRRSEMLSIGSPGCDYALYGGLPLGTIVVFSGLEGSGKSLTACLAMAAYQKKFPEKTCVYVDAEHTLQAQIPFIEQMTGLDFSRVLIYDTTGKAAEEIFGDIITMQSEAEDIGMIIIDSLPCLVSKDELNNDFDKDAGMRASIAKPLGKFMKMMVAFLPKRNNILLCINQVREDGKTFTGATIYKEPCGHAPKFYPSVIVRFGRRKYTLGDKVDIADSKSEGSDGFRTQFTVTKLRTGAIVRGGGFATYRYATGIDKAFDTIEIALKFGYIERPNAQTNILVNLDTGEPFRDTEGNELKFRGKPALMEYLRTNTEFTDYYIDMLSRHISGESKPVSLLDENDLKEILDMDESIMRNTVNEQWAEDSEDSSANTDLAD